MVLAGGIAARYTPGWFDPEDDCALRGLCGEPSPVLGRLWWVEGVGFALVVLGLAAVRRPPYDPGRRPAPAALHTAVVGLAGAVLFLIAGPVLLFAVLISTQAACAALCLLWLLQIGVLTTADRAFGPAVPARRLGAADPLTGLFALAVVAAGGLALAKDVFTTADGVLLVLLHGGCLAVGSLVTRRGPTVGTIVVAVLGLVAVGAVVVQSGVLAAPPAPVVRSAPVAPATTTPPPVPIVTPAAPPTTSTPTPTVAASVPCAAHDLAWSTVGWDAAMGARAVSVAATNTGPRPCYLDGFAGVRIDRGPRALQLTVQDGDPTDPYIGASASRVGVAPGGTVSFPLAWRMHAAGTDPTTPQSLQVALPAEGTWSDVALSAGPAPFDLADGATITVGGWRP
jgi:hypothetical protein